MRKKFRLVFLPFLLPVAFVGWVLFYFGSKKAEAKKLNV